MTELVIDPDGTIRTIYSEEAVALLQDAGELRIRRASHVEPFAGLTLEARQQALHLTGGEPSATDWFADMTPVGGPVHGPFATRDEALTWETNWLLENNIPDIV